MGSNTPSAWKEEVTRTVRLTSPSTVDQNSSATPHQRQAVTWNGPLEDLLGYSVGEVESTEEGWLNLIHPDDGTRILNSLKAHLSPAPDRPFAAESRIWGEDYRLRRANGSYVLVSDRAIVTRDACGNAICLESVIFDKDARRRERQRHAKVLESQNILELVANNTPSGIFMMDPQGYCLFMNSAAEQITGFLFDEICDYTFHASVHSCRPNGDPYPLHECPVFGHQQSGTAAKNEPEVFVHKDGHHYDIEYSVSPLGSYASGGAVIEFRDVTEQKKNEKERLNAMLVNEQQATRIHADGVHKANMTSFVSFVCHELRNPLQGVTSSAEFLSDTLQKLEALTYRLCANDTATVFSHSIDGCVEHKTPTNGIGTQMDQAAPTANRNSESLNSRTRVEMQSLVKYAKELVGNIQTCAEHQALITNNVLDLSRLDAGKVQPLLDVVDIQALGKQTVEMMSAKARRKHIDLSISEDGSWLQYLMADATILRQVLLNLISNAIKFTTDYGKITISMYADPPDEHGKIILHGSVTDNGLGMSEAEQERLFQRFSQANRRVAQLYGGSGLGLSISRELVRVMGGEMHVQSESGRGSTFSFTSVHTQPTNGELVNSLRASKALVERRPTVMPSIDTVQVEVDADTVPPKFHVIGVAEDNPINLQHLVKNLKTLGYETVACVNGKDILDKFCDPDGMIDCCILDMSMPVMDGLEAARLMRLHESAQGRSWRVPIIALSGNALMEQVTEALAAGISDYLIKPCKKADLAKTLATWEHRVHTGAEHNHTIASRKTT